MRKLSISVRFVKPALGLVEYGSEPRNLARAMAAALRFENPEDSEATQIQEYLKEHSIKETLIKFSSLDSESLLIKLVEEENEKI